MQALPMAPHGLTEGQTTVDWSKQYLGPFDCKIIAADIGFCRFSAVLTSLTVDSTGNMRNQKTYTLTAGESNINLSQKHLGPADVTLLTGWIQRPEVSAALAASTFEALTLKRPF
jgi:hypothetical protein